MNKTGRRLATAMYLIVGCVAPIALAQQAASPAQAPWDLRPKKCIGSDTPGCKAPDDWSTAEIAKDHAHMLCVQPDAARIEEAAEKLGYSNDKFPTGEYRFEIWMDAMDMCFGGSPRQGEKVAAQWKAGVADDSLEKYAEALVLVSKAWHARGSGYARTTTPEAWELYYEFLEKADALLDDASPKLKSSGPWHALKLQIAFQVPKLKPGIPVLLREVRTSWPDSVAINSVAMHFANPKWGGSFKLMDEVARAAMEQSRAQLGAGMYALLYYRNFSGDSETTLSDTNADWPLMKQAFRDIETRHVGQRSLSRSFAEFACQMRDREEARRLFEVYDGQTMVTEAEVLADAPKDTDACRRFAMGQKET
jgi:hypothetical protein